MRWDDRSGLDAGPAGRDERVWERVGGGLGFGTLELGIPFLCCTGQGELKKTPAGLKIRG